MLRTLHQIGGIKVSQIIKDKKKYPGFQKFPPATLYRHARKPLDGSEDVDRRHYNTGRKRRLNQYDLHQVKRQISVLREQCGTFSSKELQDSCGLNSISNSAFCRYLHRLGYSYRRTRKKGVLKMSDIRKRLRFVRKIRRLYKYHENQSLVLWTKQISMYLDGVGFEYKSNPYEHSKTPGAREWRLRNEGLKRGCTTKGSKEGTTKVRFIVGISYKNGVVLCEPITERFKGPYFAKMIRRKFPNALRKTNNPQAKRILQDGDPTQNSKKAMKAFKRIGASVFNIPARSPDLNPIENLFNMVRRKLL